jgi:hypothetical protein
VGEGLKNDCKKHKIGLDLDQEFSCEEVCEDRRDQQKISEAAYRHDSYDSDCIIATAHLFAFAGCNIVF